MNPAHLYLGAWRTIPSSLVADMVRLYEEGRTFAQVACELNTNVRTVGTRLHEAGVKIPRRGGSVAARWRAVESAGIAPSE